MVLDSCEAYPEISSVQMSTMGRGEDENTYVIFFDELEAISWQITLVRLFISRCFLSNLELSAFG